MQPSRLCPRLETDVQNLEQHLEAMRATYQLNEEKLKYNYQVLRVRRLAVGGWAGGWGQLARRGVARAVGWSVAGQVAFRGCSSETRVTVPWL